MSSVVAFEQVTHQFSQDAGVSDVSLRIDSDAELGAAMLRQSVWSSPPLGFNSTYTLGMRRDRAAALGITRLSDLKSHHALRFLFSSEFMQRADGWPNVRSRYHLRPPTMRYLSVETMWSKTSRKRLRAFLRGSTQTR